MSTLILPPHIFQQRVADIAQYLNDQGIKAAIVCGESVQDLGVQIYGNGMERVTAAIVTRDGDIQWVVPKLETSHLLHCQPPCAPAESIHDYGDYMDNGVDGGLYKLFEVLSDYADNTVLVEPHFPESWTDWLTQMGFNVIVDQQPFVQVLQAERGLYPAESKLMDYSLELATMAMNMMLEAVAKGVHTAGPLFFLKSQILQAMMQRFGLGITDCSVLMGPWPGPESYMEHYIPDLADKLRPGMGNILFVFSELYRYYAELERPVFIGQPPATIVDAWRIIQEATSHAINENMFRAGVPVSDLDQMVQDYIAERLGRDGINHRCGHLIGTAHHFLGNHGGIVSGSTMKLLPNCRYAWEPAHSNREVGTVRMSVPFHIDGDGTVRWLQPVLRPIEDLIIPEVAPLATPEIQFMDLVRARGDQLRAELAAR